VKAAADDRRRVAVSTRGRPGPSAAPGISRWGCLLMLKLVSADLCGRSLPPEYGHYHPTTLRFQLLNPCHARYRIRGHRGHSYRSWTIIDSRTREWGICLTQVATIGCGRGCRSRTPGKTHWWLYWPICVARRLGVRKTAAAGPRSRPLPPGRGGGVVSGSRLRGLGPVGNHEIFGLPEADSPQG
jgi:hypothetical protein